MGFSTAAVPAHYVVHLLVHLKELHVLVSDSIRLQLWLTIQDYEGFRHCKFQLKGPLYEHYGEYIRMF